MQTTEKRDCNSKIFQQIRVPANSSATSFQAGNGRERESADVQDRRYEDGGEECREFVSLKQAMYALRIANTAKEQGFDQ